MDVIFKAEAHSKPVRAVHSHSCTCTSTVCLFLSSLRYEGTSAAVQEAGNPKPHGTTSGLYTVLTFRLKPVCVEFRVHDLRRTPGCVTRGSIGSSSGSEAGSLNDRGSAIRVNRDRLE